MLDQSQRENPSQASQRTIYDRNSDLTSGGAQFLLLHSGGRPGDVLRPSNGFPGQGRHDGAETGQLPHKTGQEWQEQGGDGRKGTSDSGLEFAGRAPRCYAVKRTFWTDKRYICTLPEGHGLGHYAKVGNLWFRKPTSSLIDSLYDHKLSLVALLLSAVLCGIVALVSYLGGSR